MRSDQDSRQGKPIAFIRVAVPAGRCVSPAVEPSVPRRLSKSELVELFAADLRDPLPCWLSSAKRAGPEG
ncbi:hypothetical protein OEW28_14905 [Defluviimonas sp. WL0002]|uniref:Uncharacterized protein n=1 Tax=Albidovulum marisflavi TaxID=2984159 RepID=A0ABT2ZFK1_9RHOB|nr:hypothetical protein [Defluviimonas sp. WL0002]MCV2869918.1 hypothetical protein [Defluviimonas sp. WL0002]